MTAAKFKDLVDMQRKAVEKFPSRRLFGTKRHSTWHWITYGEFGKQVDECRGGLKAAGIGEGDAVAIIAGNRVEWAVAAYATYGLGAMYIPMYEHQLEKDWRYIAEDSGAKLLIVSTRDIYDRVKNWPKEMSDLEEVIGLELPQGDDRSFLDLLKTGRRRPAEVAALEPGSTCGFIYTSGTTGNPKGVLLTHSNIVSNINAVHEIFPLEVDEISVSFLPWAHSFGQTCELHCMMSMGCSVAFAESIDKLVDNFMEIKPTILLSVPRIFNKIYDGLQKKMDEAGFPKKHLFEAAMGNEKERRSLAEKGQSSLWADLKHALFDKLVFSKVRDRFGGRLKYAVSGGAALSTEVAEFIDNLGIQVFEGYGLTETSPIVSANNMTARKIGTVGKPIPGVTVKIDASGVDDESGEGEIVVYGPNIMKGYHRLKKETDAVMTEDGGFRTGDRGRIDAQGFLYITGRIKEQYKLTNGKYVVPAPLEEQLQLSPFVTQAFIDGANKPFNAALVVPDQVALEKWAKGQGTSAGYEELLKKPETKHLIASELAQFSSGFKGYERIKEFALIAEEFTTENDMLTPTLKLKRRNVLKKYGDLLNSLWG